MIILGLFYFFPHVLLTFSLLYHPVLPQSLYGQGLWPRGHPRGLPLCSACL